MFYVDVLKITYVKAILVRMYSVETVGLRSKLRQVISDSVPDCTTPVVYEKLKTNGAQKLTLGDLAPFAESVNIPAEKLPLLLQPYGVTDKQITLASWRSFYEDEFSYVTKPMPIPQTLNKAQIEILTNFAARLRSRTESKISVQWTYMLARNPTGASSAKIRLSAFCHLVDEMDLAFDHAMLIDALLAFFGKKTTALDFNEFALFMQTFE